MIGEGHYGYVVYKFEENYLNIVSSRKSLQAEKHRGLNRIGH